MHSAGASRADREAGAGVRNVHGAAAVPGGAWARLLRGCGAAAGGGSSERGGPNPPRAVALSTATARDPGHRHLNQDGGRAGPPEHAQSRAGSGSSKLCAGFGVPCTFLWLRTLGRIPPSLQPLRQCWTPCCGASTTWVSVAPERRRPRTARRIPDAAGPRGPHDLLAPGRQAGLPLRRLPLRDLLTHMLADLSLSSLCGKGKIRACN